MDAGSGQGAVDRAPPPGGFVPSGAHKPLRETCETFLSSFPTVTRVLLSVSLEDTDAGTRPRVGLRDLGLQMC